jgi:hypothetical protein
MDFASSCKSISSLTLKGPFLVTDGAYSKIFEGLGEKLEVLCLENAAKFSKGALQTLAARCPNLRKLSLGQCRNLGNDGVGVIASLQNLKILELMDLGNVTDEVIIDILRQLGAGLDELALTG